MTQGGLMKRNLSIALIFTVAFFAQQVHAATWKYPGAAPCNTTLQNCIFAAASGDIVKIAAAQVDEDLTIDKTLTMLPANGAVTIGGNGTARTIFVHEDVTAATVHVRLNQLTLNDTKVSVQFQSGKNHSFELMNSVVKETTNTDAISIYTTVASSFLFRQNTIVTPKTGIGVYSNGGNVQIHFDAIANEINTGSGGNGGINLDLNGNVDFFGNAYSNLIYGIGAAMTHGGIAIFGHDNAALNMNISNNTIDDSSADGIDYYPAANNTGYANIYNNIVTNVTNAWLSIGPANPAIPVQHDYNTYFNAGTYYSGHLPGPNTYVQSPGYVDAPNQNFALTMLSPCLNSGTDQLPTSDMDVLGRPRALGGMIDRGAVEDTSIFLTNYLLFADDFEDTQLNPSYSYLKPNWNEDGKNLIGSSTGKAVMLFAPTAACFGNAACYFEGSFRIDGQSAAGAANKMSILGWYQDSKNYFELLINESSNKLVLKHRVNGVIVSKGKASLQMDPQAEYRLRFGFSGGNDVFVMVDKSLMIDLPVAQAPSGGFGFQVTKTTGYLANAFVYNP